MFMLHKALWATVTILNLKIFKSFTEIGLTNLFIKVAQLVCIYTLNLEFDLAEQLLLLVCIVLPFDHIENYCRDMVSEESGI
jgi:hypothetical protein